MTIKDKLEKFDLYDQSITRHGMLDTIRDYEVIGYLCGADCDEEVQFIFKGCIKVDYKIKVKPEHYSMDDRLLDLDRQNDVDYPKGFVWGARHAVVFPGWTLTEYSDELKQLEKVYGLKFYQIYFDTNAYYLTLTFHDIDVKRLKLIDKK